MKEEFLTVRGKVIIENGKLYIRNLLPSRYNDSYATAWLIIFASSRLFFKDNLEVVNYLILGLVGLLLVIGIVDVIAVNRWKNKFALREIKSLKKVNDIHGIETTVVLTLRSGTQKMIKFRTAENQHEAFLDLLTRSITQLEPS